MIQELLFDRSRGSDDDDDFSGDFGLEEMEGVEKIEEEKEKCDGDDRDSSDSDIEFVKAVNTKSHAKVERGSTVDDKYAKIPSSEGSEDDEGEDAVDEGNPFKT